jgi:hypothetical protein
VCDEDTRDMHLVMQTTSIRLASENQNHAAA